MEQRLERVLQGRLPCFRFSATLSSRYSYSCFTAGETSHQKGGYSFLVTHSCQAGTANPELWKRRQRGGLARKPHPPDSSACRRAQGTWDVGEALSPPPSESSSHAGASCEGSPLMPHTPLPVSAKRNVWVRTF